MGTRLPIHIRHSAHVTSSHSPQATDSHTPHARPQPMACPQPQSHRATEALSHTQPHTRATSKQQIAHYNVARGCAVRVKATLGWAEPVRAPHSQMLRPKSCWPAADSLIQPRIMSKHLRGTHVGG
jgi:hypothetical protein